jgi:outer membrane lipoprotein SlyB
MNVAKLTSALLVMALLVEPATAATSLSSKDRARVARSAPRDRDDVRYCLLKRKKGSRKGTIIGAAGGAGLGLVAGGNLGETALAAGVGALAGNALGGGTSTDRTCDRVLARNR